MLLGKPAINRLEIAKLKKASTYSCNGINTTQPPQEPTSNQQQQEENKFIKDYPEVFNGLGDIAGHPINIELKPDTTPYQITAPWHIPISLFRLFQERHAITCTCTHTHANTFRSEINCTCKSNFWIQIFTTYLPAYDQDMCLFSYVTIKQLLLITKLKLYL